MKADPKDSCWWAWNGVAWVEHPSWPHSCPEFHTCRVPIPPGSHIADEEQTECIPIVGKKGKRK
jgi:hypothetical protein